MSSALRRNNAISLLKAPTERKPFSGIGPALELAGCERKSLLLEWAALADGRKVGLGFSDARGRHAGICLEFGEGALQSLQVMRPHDYSKEFIVHVRDTLPPASVSAIISAREFSISFESYTWMPNAETLRILPWTAYDAASEKGYSLEIKCGESASMVSAGETGWRLSEYDRLLDSLVITAKQAPAGLYLLDLSL